MRAPIKRQGEAHDGTEGKHALAERWRRRALRRRSAAMDSVPRRHRGLDVHRPHRDHHVHQPRIGKYFFSKRNGRRSENRRHATATTANGVRLRSPDRPRCLGHVSPATPSSSLVARDRQLLVDGRGLLVEGVDRPLHRDGPEAADAVVVRTVEEPQE